MQNILIIEDEQLQQEAYRIKLSKSYNVEVVSTEIQMLGKLQTFSPHLIILDIMLPGGKNGFDILTELKANPKTQHIPVLVLTNLDESERKTALDLGATEYIPKTSVNMDDIETIVEKHILKEQA